MPRIDRANTGTHKHLFAHGSLQSLFFLAVLCLTLVMPSFAAEKPKRGDAHAAVEW